MGKTITTAWMNETINGIKITHPYPCHSSNYTNSASRTVSYVIIHYTGNKCDEAKSNCKYFQTANRKASAHFFVDNSNILQSVELRDSAWAIGCNQGYKTSARNTNTLHIEMCCTAGNYKIGTQTQINSAYLCARLCKLVGITANQVDTYVLRHYDCVKSNKYCPKQYVEIPREWNQFKTWVKNILNTGSHLGGISLVKDGVDYSYVFNAKYYADKYVDLKNKYGYNELDLFNHFIKSGMSEKRQAKSDFDVVKYATDKGNNDLVKAFGTLNTNPKEKSPNAYLYYKHYCTNGHKEPRVHI